MSTFRRRPVPKEWREENHWLSVSSHVAGGKVRGVIPYRARGKCSCGVEFNPAKNADGTLSHSNTMDRADVIEEWKDHVEEAYYPDASGDMGIEDEDEDDFDLSLIARLTRRAELCDTRGDGTGIIIREAIAEIKRLEDVVYDWSTQLSRRT